MKHDKFTIAKIIWKYISFCVVWCFLLYIIPHSADSDYWYYNMRTNPEGGDSFAEYCDLIKSGMTDNGLRSLFYIGFLLLFGAMCYNFLREVNYIFITAMAFLFIYAFYMFGIKYVC